MSSDETDLGPDPTQPRLENAAKAGHPFSFGWSREVRAVMAGLDSARFMNREGPWVLDSPFEVQLARLSAVIPDTPGHSGLSSIGWYRDGLSTSAGSSSEHLSASLGFTVGYPFLNANVTAKYDKAVSSDSNSVKASRNSSCRVGRVILDRTPKLSHEAIALLQAKDGPENFRKRYGDFYIYGFGLGADAGACMSASSEATSSRERLDITVQVKVLFYSKSVTHTELKTSNTQSSSIAFSGYSTLDTGPPCALTSTSSDQQQALGQRATEYLNKVESLQSTVRDVMGELGLVDGARLPLSDCARLCASGLVVELLVAPFARLNQWVESIGSMRVD